MERTQFNKPVNILVGLGYPAKIHSAKQAYEFLSDRPAIAESKAQSVALQICKAALKGEVDAETARSALVAFAERKAILGPERAGQSRAQNPSSPIKLTGPPMLKLGSSTRDLAEQPKLSRRSVWIEASD